MLDKNINKVLNIAMQICIKNQSEYVTSEHLLQALTELEDSEIMFYKLGMSDVEFDNLKEKINDFVSDKNNFVISTEGFDVDNPKVTPALQRIMESILDLPKTAGIVDIGVEYILYLIAEEGTTYSSFLLKNSSIDFDLIENMNKINETTKNQNDIYQDVRQLLEEKYLLNQNHPTGIAKYTKKQNHANEEENIKRTVGEFTVNITKKVIEEQISEIIGREEEIDNLLRVLLRKKKNNAIIVGDPGVGKTSLVEGLAFNFQKKEEFSFFKEYEIVSLEISKMLAGTKYRGEFEERINKLIQFLENKSNVILFIDEIHSVIDVSNSGNSSYSELGNALKPYLTSGKLKIIGATTHEDFYKIEKDKSFNRRFSKIEIKEPNEEEAKHILMGIKKNYETHHDVEFTEDSIELIVKLSKKYLLDTKLPDSAISIMDDIGSRRKMIGLLKNEKNVSIIDTEFTKEMFQEITKIPKSLLTIDDNSGLVLLEEKLKKTIFGQDKAVDTLLKKIITFRAGLGDQERPAGVFLFSGPTGSGKTELTKEIAKNLSMNLIRVDMSEFMEKGSVSKIIGSPSGYVGYEDGAGFLIKEVKKNPNSVILLDEIEKAHPEVLNIFLQVMDYGTLKASDGTNAYFFNSIIVMTSNVGGVDLKTVGFNKSNLEDIKKDKQFDSKFSPEFLNRLDAIIKFDKLKKEDGVNIVNKFIEKIEQQLNEKRIKLNLSELAKEYLIEKGFDEKMGARPLKKVIYDNIIQKVAHEMLFGDLKKGGTANFVVVGEELKLETKTDVK